MRLARSSAYRNSIRMSRCPVTFASACSAYLSATFHEDGNRATDHGHGNTMWTVGGGISGGKLAGEQTGLSEKTLFQNRDLPLLNDYRSVLSHVFSRMVGLNAGQLDSVFPDSSIRDYGIV